MNPELYLSYPEANFWADFSFVDFPDEYLSSMDTKITSALQVMRELENGAIANPDENRMVGHYWLRHPEISFFRLANRLRHPSIPFFDTRFR